MIYPTSAPIDPAAAPACRSCLKGANAAGAIAIALSLSIGALLLPSSAHADEDKAPTTGRSTGSRGCSVSETTPRAMPLPAQAEVPALILLAPSQQRGQTVSTHPTFAWFVRDRAALPLEFRIYEQTAAGYTLLKEIKGDSFQSVPGIMTLPPLAQLPKLDPGKRYRWQVEMVCNPARPSGNPFAEAEVDVVPLTPTVKQQLLAAKSAVTSEARLSQAQIYAQANLWYDALAVTLPSSQDSLAVQDFRRTLLDRIAINPAERQLLYQSAISPIAPQLSGR